MAKAQKNYVCQECGTVYGKWLGKCEACNSWNTIIEDNSSASFTKLTEKTSKAGRISEGNVIEFQQLDKKQEDVERTQSGIKELDRVLGGGIVAGSAILLGGDPGIGKSTILLQLVSELARKGKVCSYITGEESVDQIRIRAKRLGVKDSPIAIASATSVKDIIANLKKTKSDLVIIDSIQTMYLDTVESAPGTVNQVRSSAYELINFAKQTATVLVLVGHVTKDGQISGPKVLEHMVDTVLYFEGDRGINYRILRSVKNRFGPANEIGVFEMSDKGLSEVLNPSSLFLSEKDAKVSGSAIFAGIEGTRPILVEIQALVSPSFMASPRRTAVGWDPNRLAMIIAVLGARAGVNLHDKEVYLNVAGGLRLTEPAADLAVAAAIISALTNVPLPQDSVFFGEIALSGQVRKVSQTEARLKESQKLGFSKFFCNTPEKANNNFIFQQINHINDLKKVLSIK